MTRDLQRDDLVKYHGRIYTVVGLTEGGHRVWIMDKNELEENAGLVKAEQSMAAGDLLLVAIKDCELL